MLDWFHEYSEYWVMNKFDMFKLDTLCHDDLFYSTVESK